MTRVAHGAGRRIGVLIVGVVLILAGVALLVLPGPGLLLILAGLAVLSTEFDAARRVQRRLLGTARAASARVRSRRHT